MSADFGYLLAAVLLAAVGAGAALFVRGRWLPAVVAALLYALSGVAIVLAAMVTGDGRLLPGLQLNPDLVRHAVERHPAPHPALALLALAAHALAWAPRPSRASFLAPLPATLGFLVCVSLLMARADEPRPTIRDAVAGPRDVAFLTLAPDEESTRVVISAGSFDALFLPVLFVEAAPGVPPPPVDLHWTADGEAVVLSVRGERLLAVTLAGEVAGALPSRAIDWPAEEPALDPVAARVDRSRARREVAEFVLRHGGLFVG